MAASPTFPRATYRIQAHGAFGFDHIAELSSYLAQLGVSHVYLSPILTAAPGSQHGYDVIDHDYVNPELGGDAAHRRMCERLQASGLGQLLDIVPNHMAIIGQNRLWWDVLENGPSSHYAAFFDVDWEGGNDTRVLLPILGEHYVDALRQGLVKVARHDGEFIVQYYDHRLPAAPRSLGALLHSVDSDHEELAFLADSLGELSAPTSIDREATLRRQRDKAVLFGYLDRLLKQEPELCQRIDARLEQLNRNVEELDHWLERQNWRVVHWQNASTELGYRRFFDVNTLAGLRVEDQRVFERVHRLVLRWLSQSTIDGVRIDHVDGLRDPLQYFQRLRQAAPDAWIVVEKILEADEQLNPHWPIDGTTGYEFIRLCDQLFVDKRGEQVITQLDEDWSRDNRAWDERVREAKQQIVREVLASERDRLTDLAHRVLTRRIELRDTTRRSVELAITALLISYPVYRTYVRVGSASDHDKEVIADVIASAAALRPEVDARVFEGLERVLTLQWSDELETELALRIQQTTGATMAKAVEDTLFYRHTRLLALNEVGGSPETFGIGLDDFHGTLERASADSLSMLASATHDTKRGEDTRARLLALSELPELWAQATQRWSERTRSYRPEQLDRPTEYFLYQTLVGSHPLSVERALAYMQKAVREKKRETSWIRPDADYEAALEAFVRAVSEDRDLQHDIEQFVGRIAYGGYVTSLSRTLLKLTTPGVPDLYQGTELWDFSLVDPDNRSPVDYAKRQHMLSKLEQATPESVLTEIDSGLPKLWLVWKTLQLRKRAPELFALPYARLAIEGPDSEHVVAFARGGQLVCAVPRLNAHAEPKHRSASVILPDGRFQNVLVPEQRLSGTVRVADLWARFPVALLVKET